MKVPSYLYDKFPNKEQEFEKIEVFLSSLIDEKKQELFPKINDNVVLTKLVYRFLIYLQIALWRVCDVSTAILKCWEDKNTASAFILLRALYENVSVIVDADIRLVKLIAKRDFISIHKLIINLTFCTQNEIDINNAVQKELERIKKGIGDFKNEEEVRKTFTARNILKAMDNISKVIPEHRDDYEHLSEFTHPNANGMIRLYGKWKDEFTIELSNENGVNEVNISNFFSRFAECLDLSAKAYDAILNKFNVITEIANDELRKQGRDSEIYDLPVKKIIE